MKELNHCPSTLADGFPLTLLQLAKNCLADKMKRTYLRIVKERIQKFNRKSE